MWSGYSEKGTGSQERGPGSFVFTPPGTAVSAEAGPRGRAVEVQQGVVGPRSPGNTAPTIRIPQASEDRTLQALMKFGEDQIAPELAKARDRRFIQGVQKAASGQAMAEIVNEQPWYTKIFGEGPVVEGAQAYNVQAKTEQWAQAQEREMGKLAQQSPEAVPSYLMASMDAHLTGDPATDSLIKANMVKSVPSLIKQHTKAYYKGQQEKIAESQINAMLTAGQSIQIGAQADPGMVDPQDMDNRKLNQLATWTPASFQDQDSYDRATKTVIQLHAEAGDFHALRNLRDAGVIGHMKAEDRLKVEQTINRFGAYHASQASSAYAEKLAAIRIAATNGEISALEVAPAYDAINLDYQSRSGNDQPIVAKSAYVGDMVRAAHAAKTAEEHAMRIAQADAHAAGKAVAEAQDEVQRNSIIMQQAKFGNAATLTAMEYDGKNFKEGDVDRAIYAAFAGDPSKGQPPMSAEEVMPMLAANATKEYTNPYIKKEIAGIVNSGLGAHMNDDFLKGYALWKSMRYSSEGVVRDGGIAAAANYFPEVAQARFRAFEQNLGGRDAGQFGELAYQRALMANLKPGHTFTKDEAKDAGKLLTKQYNTSFMGIGGRALTAEAQRVALQAMQGSYGNVKDSVDPGTAFTEAHSRAKAAGLEVVGSHAWVGQRDDRRLEQYLQKNQAGAVAPTKDQIGDALDHTVSNLMLQTTGKASADSYTLIRTGDRHGEAQFQLFTNVDGEVRPPIGFTSADIRMQIEAEVIKETAPALAKQTRINDRNTSRDPSIYKDYPGQMQDRLNELEAARVRYVKSNSDTRGLDQAIADTKRRLAKTLQ